MTVGNINKTGLQTSALGMAQGSDAYSRNLQNQIANAQKRLKETASNQELPPEEKMKKKQEIQQEIASLNQQLRQHQMEVRREAAQKKESSKEDARKESRQEQSGRGGKEMSRAGIQALISADASMEQAKVQGCVKAHLEGRAGVLKAEIKQDGSTGGNTAAKEAELAEAENKAAAAGRAQAGTLAEANKNLQESAQEDAAGSGGRDRKGSDSLSKTEEERSEDNSAPVSSEHHRKAKGASEKDGFKENNASEDAEGAMAEAGMRIRYTPIDLRL